MAESQAAWLSNALKKKTVSSCAISVKRNRMLWFLFYFVDRKFSMNSKVHIMINKGNIAAIFQVFTLGKQIMMICAYIVCVFVKSYYLWWITIYCNDARTSKVYAEQISIAISTSCILCVRLKLRKCHSSLQIDQKAFGQQWQSAFMFKSSIKSSAYYIGDSWLGLSMCY